MLFIVGFQPVKQYMDASFRADLQAGSGTVLSVASEKMVIQKHSQVNVCNLQQPIQLILDDLSTRILLGEGWYYCGGAGQVASRKDMQGNSECIALLKKNIRCLTVQAIARISS